MFGIVSLQLNSISADKKQQKSAVSFLGWVAWPFLSTLDVFQLARVTLDEDGVAGSLQLVRWCVAGGNDGPIHEEVGHEVLITLIGHHLHEQVHIWWMVHLFVYIHGRIMYVVTE